MAAVIPLRRPQTQGESACAYRSISPEAREAFVALEGRMNALKRIFAGSFATTTAHDQIETLCDGLENAVRKLRRAAK